MPGKKGMKRKSATHSVRRQIWCSMRILRRFTKPDLLRTAPAATSKNVEKFLSMLHHHGYITKVGSYVSGRTGEYQEYLLIDNCGPAHPTVCARCGEFIAKVRVCRAPEQKEKEKEREKESATSPPEVTHDAA